jgi:hypothetical protein
MCLPYNTTAMSGFVRGDSIIVGRLKKTQIPAVRFLVNSGSQSHPVFVVEPKLLVEMYAWHLAMQQHGVERVNISFGSTIFSGTYTSTMFANYLDFNVSNPDVRVEAERRKADMFSGRTKVEWPDTEIRMPLHAKQFAAARYTGGG